MAGAELSRVKQSRAERGQELGRNWGGARNVLDRSLKGAGQEYGRDRAGQKLELGRSSVGKEHEHERTMRVAIWE